MTDVICMETEHLGLMSGEDMQSPENTVRERGCLGFDPSASLLVLGAVLGAKRGCAAQHQQTQFKISHPKCFILPDLGASKEKSLLLHPAGTELTGPL